MKRVLAIFLSIVFVFLLSGCNKSTVVSSTIDDNDFDFKVESQPIAPEQPAIQNPENTNQIVEKIEAPKFVDYTNQSFLNENKDPTNLKHVEAPESATVVNVKDYGAKGDGVANDRTAIYNAFEYAVNNLPATVYFPAGEYALRNGGIYIPLPLGSSGLTVKGDGADKSVIKYAEDWKTKGSWVALRIMPQSTPTTREEYIKNITIKDIGVYDTDPINHAWNIEKGNELTEETHGLDIQYCIGATVRNCKISNVGDEAIDMVFCIDSTVSNNIVLNSPAAGKSGGAISIGDGSENVLVENNTVDGSIPEKNNFGIAIEALSNPVKNVQIRNNTVKNISGNAFNFGAPKGTIDNVILYNNKISNCTKALHFLGNGKKSNVKIIKTEILTVKIGLSVEGLQNENVTLENFNMDQVINRAVFIKAGNNIVVKNGVMTNLQRDAIWNSAANTLIQNIKIDTVGTTVNTSPAIFQFVKGGNISLENVTVANCKSKVAIKSAQNITNVSVEQVQKTGYYSVQGAQNIKGGYFNRPINGLKADAVIDGVAVSINQGMGKSPAIYLTVSGCTVKNCTVFVPSGIAIGESAKANLNTVTSNNCVGGTIVKNGANSVFENNVAK